MAVQVKWVYGKHPSDEMIKDYIDNGQMYYVEENGMIQGAVALTPFQNEDYKQASWSIKLNNDDVMVVHILCVNPKKQRTGIAKAMLDEILRLAKEMGLKAIRLDALYCNDAAQKLYEKYGFVKHDTKNWYVDNLCWKMVIIHSILEQTVAHSC